MFMNVLDINECSSEPCHNNATCLDQVAAFECVCAAGFTGNQCDRGSCPLSTVRVTKVFEGGL